jgi:uncharacterized protein YPO0396
MNKVTSIRQAFACHFYDYDKDEDRVVVIKEEVKDGEPIIDAVDRVIEKLEDQLGYYPEDLEVV